jgi:hypothetical protein
MRRDLWLFLVPHGTALYSLPVTVSVSRRSLLTKICRRYQPARVGKEGESELWTFARLQELSNQSELWAFARLQELSNHIELPKEASATA